EPAVPPSEDKRPPICSDTRIDDGEVNADWHVLESVRQHERPLKHLLRRDAVGDVDDLSVRGDATDDPVARTDVVIRKAKIAQEGDAHAPESTVVFSTRAADSTASTRPPRSCVAASATIRSPALWAALVVCGPSETTGRRTPIAARARAAEAEKSTATSASGRLTGRRGTVR